MVELGAIYRLCVSVCTNVGNAAVKRPYYTTSSMNVAGSLLGVITVTVLVTISMIAKILTWYIIMGLII